MCLLYVKSYLSGVQFSPYTILCFMVDVDFGGIRLEDDVLVTADGARRLGRHRLPIFPDDIEAAMKK